MWFVLIGLPLKEPQQPLQEPSVPGVFGGKMKIRFGIRACRVWGLGFRAKGRFLHSLANLSLRSYCWPKLRLKRRSGSVMVRLPTDKGDVMFAVRRHEMPPAIASQDRCSS